MATIKKKTWPKHFELVRSGKKSFEVRLADFEVQEGDTLILEEWDPETKQYTGRRIEKKADFVFKFNLDDFGQKKEIKEKGLYVIQFMPQVFSAVKAIVQHGGKFLIIKEVIGDKVIWELPGGKVDYGESPYQALHREVAEEVGLDIEIVRPVGVWWFFRISDKKQVVCHTFICKPKDTNIDLTKNPQNEYITEFKWVSKEEFLSDKYPGAHPSLKELISGLQSF